MSRGARRWILVAGLVVAAAASGQEVDEHCPVWPERLASAEHELTYGGRSVRFCCATCRRLFEADPKKYLANVPGLDPAALEDEEETASWRGLEALRRTGEVGLYALLALLAVALVTVATWRRRGAAAAGPRYEVIVLLLLTLGAGFFMGRRILELETQVEDLRQRNYLFELEKVMHNNTYIDYGDPPIPSRPPVAPRLASVYYRGNDERSPELFNGGDYLTAWFRLSLHGADGRPLRHGDTVGEEWLQVRFEIERAPNTPDYFWSDDIMGHIYLTRQTDRFLGLERPVADRVDLAVLEPLQRWEALYPVGRLRGAGAERLEGVIYVADEWRQHGKVLGATLHYAVQYEITVDDGRVAPASDLWMGALFRPRKSPVWKVPPEEWLSHEPIPPKPEPGVDDPELLGIDDYLDES